MPLSRLHPLFVEICQRVRLGRGEENLFARIANSDHSRVEPGDQSRGDRRARRSRHCGHVPGRSPTARFIHEESDQAFVLDIADLLRDKVTLPVAFAAAKEAEAGTETIDKIVRRRAATVFRKEKVIPTMIDRIEDLLETE